MSFVIGTVNALVGQVIAVAEDGSSRILKLGDAVLNTEVIRTVEGAQIEVALANGEAVSIANAGEWLAEQALTPQTLAQIQFQSTPIGTVNSVSGNAVAVAADGSERVLLAGDSIYPGEIISTSPDSAIQIAVDGASPITIGGGNSWVATSDTYTPTQDFDPTAAASSDIDAIQAAILAGVDPTQNAEATAAGVETPTEDGGSSFVTLERTAAEVNPEAGFDTVGLNQTVVTTNEEQAAPSVAIAVNNPPVAVNDSITTDEDTPVTIDVLANDYDPDGDTVTLVNATVDPEFGTVELVDGKLVFTPKENYNGDVTITYEIEDGNGGVGTANVEISVVAINDVPTITGDTGSVTEDAAATLTTSGNAVVVTDTDAGESLVAVQTNTAGTYGSFSIDENGNWSYSADNSQTAIQALGVGDTLADSFTVTSADGTATNTVVITINGTNDAPTVEASSDVTGTVTEAGHQDDGTVVAGTPEASGVLSSTDVDVETNSATWAVQGTPDSTYGTFSVTSAGVWTYTLDNTKAATQALAEDSDPVELTFTVRVTDEFGAYADEEVTVTINGTNDGPTISTDDGVAAGNDVVYEAGLATGSGVGPTTKTAVGTFTIGDADGLDDIAALTFTDTGGTTLSYTVGRTVGTDTLADLVGKTFNTANGTVEIMSYSAGVYTYEYTLTSATTDIAGTETNSFKVTVSDGTASANATVTIDIVDDAPAFISQTSAATPIDKSNITSSGTYSFLTGADGFGSVTFTLSNNGPFLDVDGNQLYVDSKPLTVSGGGTNQLTISDGDGSTAMTIILNTDGTYDVTPIMGVITSERDLGSVSLSSFSGGNRGVFAAIDGIANATLDIVATSTQTSLVYSGEVHQSTDVSASTVNSNANELGVGIGNSFDSGWSKDQRSGTEINTYETMKLQFWENVVINSSGDVDTSNGTLQQVTQVTLGINVFKDAPNTTAPLFIVRDSNGYSQQYSSSDLSSDGQITYVHSDSFEWVEIESVTGYGNKNDTSFKIDLLGITQLVAGDPIDLSFDIQGQDTDGDSVDASVSFTLQPSTAPIALDLEQDGTEYLSREAGVVFTDQSTGESVNTAWVGPDDGLLVIDANNSGTIEESREYVFTEWSETAETDMEAIADVFDTNQDGVLDAQDDQWDQFRVWQDKDSDGQTDEGELVSLGDLMIESIDLTYVADSQEGTAADVDVVIHGQSAVTYTDGSTTIAEDTSFAISEVDLLNTEDLVFEKSEESSANPSANSSDASVNIGDLDINDLLHKAVDDGTV